MGNKESKKITVTNYDHAEWKHIGTHRSVAQILISSKGNGQAEGHILYVDPKLNLEKQIEIYQYRKDQDNALVKCVAVQAEKSKSDSLCGDKKILRVLTERIPLRLNELPQLTFQQSVYVLIESLRGYKDCYNKLGPFEITGEMIGINNDGEIKVWVNDDFSENHPMTQKPLLFTSGTQIQSDQKTEYLHVRKDQVQMIRNIIKLVEKRCEHGQFPFDFSDQISKNSASFDKIMKEIEAYVTQKRLFIPDRIMNMNVSYPKGKYFTPGEQYVRDPNDPLYRQRKPFLPEPVEQNLQPLQGGKPSVHLPSYRSEPQLEVLNKSKRVNSPILSLYQQQGPINIDQGQKLLQSPNSNEKANGIIPKVQNLVSEIQSSGNPHDIWSKR